MNSYMMVTFVFFVASLCSIVASGQETQNNTKAFIAYVRDYIYVRPLKSVEKDATELEVVISKFQGHTACTSFKNSKAPEWDNSETAQRDSFEKEFDNWLRSLKKGDTAIAYLSGHGVLDDEGKVHFAMQNIKCAEDGRPINLEDASYSMDEFRDKFSACKASKKLLILDCCHSGAMEELDDEDYIAPRNANARDLNRVFREAVNVTTFASSRGYEYSLMMKDGEHSLFTFWLAYGLRGYADRDFDGQITLEELYDYVTKNVKAYVTTHHTPEQTPTIINKKEFAFNVITPHASEREEEIAKLLSYEIKNRNRELKLGVPIFSYGDDPYKINRSGVVFPEFFAMKVSAEYEKIAREESLRCIPFPEVKKRFAERELFDYKSLTPEADDYEEDDKNIALVCGNIKRKDNLIAVQVNCVDLAKDAEPFADIHCLALITKDEYPTLGDSMTAQNRPPRVSEAEEKLNAAKTKEDRDEAKRELETANKIERNKRDYVAAATANIREKEGREPNGVEKEAVLATARENAVIAAYMVEPNDENENPLENDNAYCNVSFKIRPFRPDGYPKGVDNYETRNVVFKRNTATLPLEKNEEYAIKIENTSDEKLLVSVLVDGRDTLFHAGEGEGENGLLGPRRNDIKENGLWYIPPKESFVLGGFTNRDENQQGAFHVEDFDLENDSTGLTKYKDQIGVITICVWKCGATRGSVTLAGKPTPIKLKETKVERDDYVGQYTIYYDKKDNF